MSEWGVFVLHYLQLVLVVRHFKIGQICKTNVPMLLDNNPLSNII